MSSIKLPRGRHQAPLPHGETEAERGGAPLLQAPQLPPSQICLRTPDPFLAGLTDSHRLLINSQTHPLSGGSWGSHGYVNEDTTEGAKGKSREGRCPAGPGPPLVELRPKLDPRAKVGGGRGRAASRLWVFWPGPCTKQEVGLYGYEPGLWGQTTLPRGPAHSAI